MTDDLSRLSISIDNHKFSVQDTMSGGYIYYNNGAFNGVTLDPSIVQSHLKSLNEALCSWKKKYRRFYKGPVLSTGKTLAIREDKHFTWTLSYSNMSAHLEDGLMCMSYGFDVDKVIRNINLVAATVITANKILTPDRDIVRRIIDVGVLCWVHDGHSVVHYEKNVKGNTMLNCLIDGEFYPLVIVSASRDKDSVTLFTSDLAEIITYPLDDSILHFYCCDEDVFT